MARADSDNSIAFPAVSTRRRFLSQAAGVTAGSAALALAIIPPMSAAAAPAGALDPAGWPALHPDARLFELEEKIFEHKEAIGALQPETDRLDDIWTKENHRLHDEYEATRTGPNFEQRKSIVDAMPEFKECMRLRGLQNTHDEAANDLVQQMWEIKAQTPEGRRAKVLVLLGYVMEEDEWRRVFDGAFDVTRARDLLIEFVGGEPAEQLRDQFAVNSMSAAVAS
jgi:hypothetical protein